MARLARLHPEAAAEAEAAFDWYAESSPGAARGFLHDLEAAISRVLEAPDRWPETLGGRRRYLLQRYPFLLIYRVDQHDNVEIVAVAHAKRRPGYWRDR